MMSNNSSPSSVTVLNVRQKVIRLAVVAVAYFISVNAGLLFIVQPDNIAGIWPASGVALAILLLHPRSMWSSILSVIFVMNGAANLLSGNSLVLSAAYGIANTMEPAFGAWCIVQLSKEKIEFKQFNDVIRLGVCALLCNAITSFISTWLTISFTNGSFWSVWRIWWIADGLGMLIFTPLIIAWLNAVDKKLHVNLRKIFEGIIFLTLFYLLFRNISIQNVYSHYTFFHPYMLLSFALWLGYRFSVRSTTLINTLIAGTAIGYILIDGGVMVIAGAPRTELMLFVQTFLVLFALTSLGISGMVNNRKLSEEGLRESEKRYRSIVEHVNDAFYIHDFTGKILDCNSNACKMLGYTKEELIHATLSLFDSPVETQLMLERMSFLKDRGFLIFDGKHKRKDGTMIFVNVSVRIVSYEGNGTIQSLVRDISEIKYNEDRIIQSDEELKKAQQIAKVGNWKWYSRTGYIEMSDEMYRILGVDRAHYHGTIAELMSQTVHPDDLRKVEENVRLFINKKILTNFEVRIVMRDKSIKTIWVNAGEMLKDDKGIASILTGTVQDISGRKQSEAILQESEERFRSIFKNTNIGLAVGDLQGHFVEINPAIEKMLGYTVEELRRLTIPEITHPDDLEADAKAFKTLFERNLNSYQLEKKFIHKDGHVVVTKIVITLLRDKNRNPLYPIAMIEDITERKKAEEAIGRKTALLEAELNSTIEGVLVVDTYGKKILQNQRTIDLWKIPQHIADNVDDSTQVQHVMQMTKNPERFVDKIMYLYNHPTETSRDEVELIDGTVLDRYSASVLGKDGQNYGRIWTFHDITERKKADEALRESEERYRSIINASPDNITIADLDGHILMVSPVAKTMFGFERDEQAQGLSITDFIIPEDRERALSNVTLRLNGGTPHSNQYRGLRNDGSTFDIEVKSDFIRDVNGKPNKIVLIIRDITERKQAEAELKKNEALLQTAIENLPLIFYIINPDDKFKLSIGAGLKGLGLTPNQVVGQSVFDIYKDFPEITSAIKKALAGEPVQFESTVSEASFTNFVAPYSFGSADSLGLVGVALDITESKRNEQKIADALHYNQTIFAASPIGIITYKETGEAISANFAASTIVGATIEQLQAQNFRELESWKKSGLFECANTALSSGKETNIETSHLSTFGKQIWMSVRFVPFMHQGERKLLTLLSDITDRKRWEVQLRKSEEQLRDIASNIPGAVYQFMQKEDGQFEMLYMSAGGEILFERPIKELMDTSLLFSDVHPEDLPGFFQSIALSAQNLTQWNYEFRLILGEGKIKWIRTASEPHRVSGQGVFWNGILLDFTERMLAREALIKSKKQYDDLASNISVGIYLLHSKPDGSLVFDYVSPKMAEILCVSAESILADSRAAFEHIHPDELDTLRKLNQEHLQTKNSFIWEGRIIVRESTRWLRISSTPEPQENGIVLWNGVIEDITERKRTQEALRQSEEQFLNLFSEMVSGCSIQELIFDEHGRAVDYITIACNKSFERILNVGKKDVVGKRASEILPNEELHKWLKIFSDITIEGTTKNYEQYSPLNNKYFAGSVFSPMPGQFAVTFEDITDRKEAEKALRESEARLKKAQRYGRIGSWTWNTKTNQIEWSDEMFRLFGLEKESFSGSLPDVIAKAIHPDDREKVNQSNRSVTNEKKPTPLEYRIVWPDQSIHIVWAEAGEMEFDERGNIALLSGTVQDITERKKAELKLVQLSRAVEQSPAIIVITDTKGNIEYVNPKFTQATGYTYDEAIGQNPRMLKSGKTSDAEYREMWETILKGDEWHGEFCNKKKNGEMYWEYVIISPITNSAGIVTNFLAVKEDITERKQSQIELEASRNQLRQLASRLETIREEERKTIAREIHDELGQQLTGIKMNISLIQKKYGNESVLSEKLDYMKHLVDNGIQTVRNISKQLRPAVLDELGLIDAIKWQVREFNETSKIECSLQLPDAAIKFRPELTTGIFRIVQEALTNIVRHAEADSAIVIFVQEGNSLYLSIEDNGKGIISSDLQDVDSIGLLGMHERAYALGGEMNILSLSPRGTKIEVRLPMENS